MKYTLLDKINYPKDLKGLSIEELKQLALELREQTIEFVSQTGGHLGAGLGVIELTIALHYVFDTPNDKIVWDIGHQTYPHKILTGRKSKMPSLRKKGGISGFAKISESEYDAFGAGHSSTSISAALGMAVARDLNHKNNHVIAVIGDGSISAGMAYEALNNAGALNSKMIVILNNNDMSIARPTGAMSNYLSKITSSRPYLSFRNMAKQALEYLPEGIERFVKKGEQFLKNFSSSNDIFEDLGFYSIGPIDGHNIEDLIAILVNIRDDKTVTSPFLLHIVTEKGKGFISPDSSTEKYHAVSKFDMSTKAQTKSSEFLSYTKVFAKTLTKLAEDDENIVAITAAMPSGTGLDIFAKKHKNRMYDVGIAEQHAVTFAAGLAISGIKPFCAIYSTFLQRGYDQVVHDVAIQNLPVRFAIDRAGLVGADGPTHAGSFDITFLASLPNFVVMAPSSGKMLADAVKTASEYNKGPIAFRYPRGDSDLKEIDFEPKSLELGRGNIVKSANSNKKNKVCLVSLGTMLKTAIKIAEIVEKNSNYSVSIIDAIFVKPLDEELLLSAAQGHSIFVTLEEGSIGGFASHVLKLLEDNNILDSGKIKFRSFFLPDIFVEQGTQEENLREAGLDADSIAKNILKIVL